MSETLRALTLVSCEHDKILLDEEVLKKVLGSPEARNRPVAVISIAGMFRKGKSFFLNFVLRYLNSKCDPNWIQSQTGPLEGFEWMPSNKGVTSGITIWPEVFVVNEVAIVLMDTQGLYESSKNTREDTYIMVLSTLFSSFQILNYQENLNAAELKDFEFFTKYGMALENARKDIKAFQNLLFLIRDWKFEKHFQFGLEGGNAYLGNFLQTKINEELHSVRDTFEHFEKSECFLMPYPGDNVARSEEFNGDIKYINQKFLDIMKNVVEHLIATVKPKELLGMKANGECLEQAMKHYVECLNQGSLPEPKSLIRLQLDILQKNAENECMKIYMDRIREVTEGKLLSNAEMDKLHKKQAREAVIVFDNLHDFRSKDTIETAKSKFFETIEASEVKTRMEQKVKLQLQVLLKTAEFECMMIYNDRMMEVINDKYLKKSRMEQVHEECADEALKVLDKITDYGFPEEVEIAKTQCSKMIEEYEYRSRMEEEVKLHMRKLKNELKKRCMEIYNGKMRKGTEEKLLNNAEMDKLHSKCADEALAEFNNIPDLDYQDKIIAAKTKCIEKINASEYKAIMEEKVQRYLSTVKDDLVQNCMENYKFGMNQGTEGKLLNKHQMDQLHKESARAAFRVFNNLPDLEYQDQITTARSECDQMIEESEYMAKMEEEVKTYMCTLKDELVTKCKTIYMNRMKEGMRGRHLGKPEMDQLHNKSAAEALKVFDNLPDLEYKDQIIAAKSKCSKNIDSSRYRTQMEEKVKVRTSLEPERMNAEKEDTTSNDKGKAKGIKLNLPMDKEQMRNAGAKAKKWVKGVLPFSK